MYPTLVEERPVRFCDLKKNRVKITTKEKEQKIQQVSERQNKKKGNKTRTRWANVRSVGGENGEGRQMKWYYMLLYKGELIWQHCKSVVCWA